MRYALTKTTLCEDHRPPGASEGLHAIEKYMHTSMQHTCSRHAAWDPHTLEHMLVGFRAHPNQVTNTLTSYLAA